MKLVGVALALLAAACAAASSAAGGYPRAIAAIGDSITRAYNTEELRPFQDGPAYSWSTGTKTTVGSAYLRILRASHAAAVRRANLGRDGADMKDFARQATQAVATGADYVTVMLGSNDVCGANEAAMTSPSRFASQFAAGLDILAAGLPDARIQVVSIPDVYRLWSLERETLLARIVWRAAHICQSLLAHADSNAAADEARRLRVRARTQALNGQLGRVCALYVHCRYDGGAIFSAVFLRYHVSSRDFFHPSRAGQARLATLVWRRTFDFRDTKPPVSSAVVTPAVAGSVVTIAATDNVGVSGVEYRTGGRRWSRYGGPLTVAPGTLVEFRAVDINGNNEPEHVVIA